MAFNWVQARSKYSLGQIFICLTEVVRSDTAAANELKRDGVTFELSTPAERMLIVARKRETHRGFDETVAIVFERSSGAIRVLRRKESRGQGDLLFSATPSLDAEGECLLDVKGEPPLQLWQVSRKALEDLFFGE